jgi:hypothetical protein
VIKAWLTRRPNGSYLLTHVDPVIEYNLATDKLDAYARPGDPLAHMLPMCQIGTHRLIDDLPEIKTLEPIRIELTGKVVF